MKQKYIHYSYTYIHKFVMRTNVCLEAQAVTVKLAVIKLLHASNHTMRSFAFILS